MTFYNIIFGILFVGATKELLQAFFDQEWRKFSLALTYALIVANDVVYTSHAVEDSSVTYTVGMKLVDLLLFMILAYCLVFMNPGDNTLLVHAPGQHLTNEKEIRFWILLTLYWTASLVWDALAFCGVEAVYLILLVLLTAMIVLTRKHDPGRFVAGAGRIVRVLVPAVLLWYMIFITPGAYRTDVPDTWVRREIIIQLRDCGQFQVPGES